MIQGVIYIDASSFGRYRDATREITSLRVCIDHACANATKRESSSWITAAKLSFESSIDFPLFTNVEITQALRPARTRSGEVRTPRRSRGRSDGNSESRIANLLEEAAIPLLQRHAFPHRAPRDGHSSSIRSARGTLSK